MQQLIPFDILKKTEDPRSFVKHGPYKEDPKRLKKLKSLYFRQPVTSGEEHYFQYLPNLQDLHFGAGVDPETLHNILGYPFEKLYSLLIAKWPSAGVELPDTLSALRLLEVEFVTNEKVVRLNNKLIESLSLNLRGRQKTIDVSGVHSLTYLSIGGRLPSEELRVPENLSEISIGSPGLMINYDLTIESEPFDTKILSSSKNIISLNITSPLSDQSSQALPFIKNLSCYNSIKLVARLFPNVESFSAAQLNATQVRELLRQLPSLRKLEFRAVETSEEKIKELQEDFPQVSLTVRVDSGQPFIDRYYSNGQWIEEATR